MRETLISVHFLVTSVEHIQAQYVILQKFIPSRVLNSVTWPLNSSYCTSIELHSSKRHTHYTVVISEYILRKTMHSRADSNVNGQLELQELSAWISIKTKEHLTLALRENFFMFTAIDQNPRNGKELYAIRTQLLYCIYIVKNFS